jgi:hypothetical protein
MHEPLLLTAGCLPFQSVMPPPPPPPLAHTQVYDSNCTQMEVFAVTARPIIDAVVDGYNGEQQGQQQQRQRQ